MASRAERNVISAIAQANGLALVLKREYGDRPEKKTMHGIIGRLETSCHEAFQLWKGELSAKEIGAIFEELAAAEKVCLASHEKITVLTSMVMGLLTDILEHIRNPERGHRLDAVLRAVASAHRYFDSRGKRYDDYVVASKALDVWKKMVCAGRESFDHVWFWKSRLPERKGMRCRVLVRGRMNSVLVEFEDGYRVVTSRYAVRNVVPWKP